MKRLALATLVSVAGLSFMPASADLENYFQCTTKEGVSQGDIVAFKAEYEAAANAAGFDGYNLKVIFPIYTGERAPGSFYWYGSFTDFNQVQEVFVWFNESEWPARFDELVTCDEASLWMAYD